MCVSKSRKLVRLIPLDFNQILKIGGRCVPLMVNASSWFEAVPYCSSIIHQGNTMKKCDIKLEDGFENPTYCACVIEMKKSQDIESYPLFCG